MGALLPHAEKPDGAEGREERSLWSPSNSWSPFTTWASGLETGLQTVSLLVSQARVTGERGRDSCRGESVE